MIPGRIADATHYLGAPKGWEPERHGDCAHLPVRAEPINDGVPSLQSVWEPTPGELALLNQGGMVRLVIIGTSHPPVALVVDPPSTDAEART